MPFCPKCRYEYREGIETCADCGARLLPELPEELKAEQHIKEQFIAVYQAHDEIQLNAIKTVLAQAGIRTAEKKYLASFAMLDMSLAPSGLAYAQVYVVESQADKARQLIADFLVDRERGEFKLPDAE